MVYTIYYLFISNVRKMGARVYAQVSLIIYILHKPFTCLDTLCVLCAFPVYIRLAKECKEKNKRVCVCASPLCLHSALMHRSENCLLKWIIGSNFLQLYVFHYDGGKKRGEGIGNNKFFVSPLAHSSQIGKKNIRMISLPLHFDLLIHYDDCFEI